MKLNDKKTTAFSLDNMDKKNPSNVEFEYLGYFFSMNDVCGTEYSRTVSVGISDKKIRKIKSRIILATIAFLKEGNFGLYYARMKFVTSNYKIRRSGISLLGGNSKVKSGIFYNYRMCGIYRVPKGNNEIHFDIGKQADLKALDGFLFHIIRGKSSNLAKGLSLKLTPAQQTKICRVSFLAGFNKRMMIRMRPDDFNFVKAVWKNV